MAALVVSAGKKVILYYHPETNTGAEAGPFDLERMIKEKTELAVLLADALSTNDTGGQKSIETVLGHFFSEEALKTKHKGLPNIINLVGAQLNQDVEGCLGVPGGELFWATPPLLHASAEAVQLMAALRMRQVPTLRIRQRGNTFLTACHCVLTSDIPGFNVDHMRCNIFTVPNTHSTPFKDPAHVAQHLKIAIEAMLTIARVLRRT